MMFLKTTNKKQIQDGLVFAAVVLLLTMVPVLVRSYLGLSTSAGCLSDAGCALLLALIVLLLPRAFRVPFLLLWTVLEAASFTLLAALARFPSWGDLVFITDYEFIFNSLSGGGDVLGRFFLIFAVSGCLLFLPPRIAYKKKSVFVILLLSVLMFFVHHHLVNRSRTGENLSAQYNPAHWMSLEAYVLLKPTATMRADEMIRQDLSGERIIDKGRAKNVLLIVLEGIPGLYIKQARDAFQVEVSDINMKQLSEFARQGMVTPDFVVHGHQTIRGLYALLCADYNKLSWTTPKAYELQNAQEKARQCLPAQLKERGFDTHYLQSAGLAFMSKDQIMPVMGFDHVHGKKWFEEKAKKGKKSKKTEGWGVDDSRFFTDTLAYVDELVKKKEPWFLTLLTVGTHQPYKVPENCVHQKIKDRKKASVVCLDEAVAGFLKALKKKKILEDTLVVVTSDESHGSEIADWVSSWGLNLIFAPEAKTLPAVHKGSFGLIDTTVSILDYFDFDIDPLIPGRSLFRDYTKPRDMLSFTAGRLRWLDRSGNRFECSEMGESKKCKSSSLIGNAECSSGNTQNCRMFFKKAAWLDQSLTHLKKVQTLRFANGGRILKITPSHDAWIDNLIGAQYLDFPAGSQVHVSMKWKVLEADESGVRLKMFLKQREQDITDLTIPEIPVLQKGQESEWTFDMQNTKARSSFSFHLLSESTGQIEITDFDVLISK